MQRCSLPNLQNLSTTVPSRAGAVRRPDFALRPQTHAGLMNSNQHHLRASQFSGARTTAYPRFPQPCHQSRQSHSDPCTSSVQIRFIPVSLPSSRTRHRRILRLISPHFRQPQSISQSHAMTEHGRKLQRCRRGITNFGLHSLFEVGQSGWVLRGKSVGKQSRSRHRPPSHAGPHCPLQTVMDSPGRSVK